MTRLPRPRIWFLLLALAAMPAMHGLPALAQSDAGEPTTAQPKLATQTLSIISQSGARHALVAEIAVSERQHQAGLMFRKSLADGEAMLFDFGTPAPQSMWMKNTLIPLDMLFVDADGRITHIAENAVPFSLATIDSEGPVRAVIEIAGGLAERWDISVGDRIEGAIFPPKGK